MYPRLHVENGWTAVWQPDPQFTMRYAGSLARMCVAPIAQAIEAFALGCGRR